MSTDTNKFIQIYPSKDNIKFWKVLMAGPEKSGY